MLSAGYLSATRVSSASCSWRSVLVLSAVVGILHECSDNGLMTFCSNKFSRSDVSSILLWSELVLICPKCGFFFSLSRDFCSSERKILLSYLGHTCHTSYIQTSCKHWYGTTEWWKAEALQVNIFAAWYHSEITLIISTGLLLKSTVFTKAANFLLLLFTQLFILELELWDLKNIYYYYYFNIISSSTHFYIEIWIKLQWDFMR